MTRLSRMFRPKSLAVIGGGAWCEAVLDQAVKFGFGGPLYAIHPSKPELSGVKAYLSVNHLPEVPDVSFIGINREASIGAIERLRKLNAGGAVCFASGFSEVTAEDATGANAQERLLRAAQEMPVLGPNCYGFINALDQVAIWPDQHGCVPVESGVAIITQSSNIAINLTMQRRGLPIAYLVTCGNQAQIGQAEIAETLLDDPRITAIGMHIEGFGDLGAWQAMAAKAQARGVALVGIKIGRSSEARAGTMTHTASLSGQDDAANALMARLEIRRVDDLSTFLETLKLLHIAGPMPSRDIASISCSGGEASLCADLAKDTALRFMPLEDSQKTSLRKALGPKVALANPLDYHTYIWRDTDAMTDAWSAVAQGRQSITLIIVDYPREDICDPTDWDCATQAALRVRAKTGHPVALVASLPELLPETVARRLIAGGVVPMHGLPEALRAVEAAGPLGAINTSDLLAPGTPLDPQLLTEAEAKIHLAAHGLNIPNHSRTVQAEQVSEAARGLSFPVAVKAEGLAHKSDEGAVVLNCPTAKAAQEAVIQMAHPGPFLIEEMIPAGVELLVGVTRDPAHGFLLTLGAGGVLTELMEDHSHLLLPVTREELKQALTRLKISKLLQGYRNRGTADIGSILDAILAVQDYVTAHATTLSELEINPLICTQSGAFVADALIRQDP